MQVQYILEGSPFGRDMEWKLGVFVITSDEKLEEGPNVRGCDWRVADLLTSTV
jgi:hypothetical protein